MAASQITFPDEAKLEAMHKFVSLIVQLEEKFWDNSEVATLGVAFGLKSEAVATKQKIKAFYLSTISAPSGEKAMPGSSFNFRVIFKKVKSPMERHNM